MRIVAKNPYSKPQLTSKTIYKNLIIIIRFFNIPKVICKNLLSNFKYIFKCHLSFLEYSRMKALTRITPHA